LGVYQHTQHYSDSQTPAAGLVSDKDERSRTEEGGSRTEDEHLGQQTRTQDNGLNWLLVEEAQRLSVLPRGLARVKGKGEPPCSALEPKAKAL